MSFVQFSNFQNNHWPATRDALHSYAKVLGVIRAQLVPKQKHWWHISLAPNARGLTTGPLYNDGHCFEIILDLFAGAVVVQWHDATESIDLSGQSASTLFADVSKLLFSRQIVVQGNSDKISIQLHSGFSAETSAKLAIALSAISGVFQQFKHEQRKETSPVQLWPHHFDLAVLWFSGRLVPGQDPSNEEYADEQLNFGFSVGDQQNPEPYFYFTAYPLPDELHKITLSAGASWHTESWQGVYLPYSSLCKQSNPGQSLLILMRNFVAAGSQAMQ
jgi:hypothetical protein